MAEDFVDPARGLAVGGRRLARTGLNICWMSWMRRGTIR